LVAPDAAGGSVNFKCSWYYKNVGIAITATFSLLSDTFMNGDMIDGAKGYLFFLMQTMMAYLT
jgi:hypothetical protein